MLKKLTGITALALAGIMSLSIFNCKRTTFSGGIAAAEEDEEEEENVIHDEEDLRFIDYLEQVYYDVTIEDSGADGNISVHFNGSSDMIVGEKVDYDCVFEESSMTFVFTATYQEQEEIIETEAIIDEKGGLDGEIVIGDEETEEAITYNVSDYKNDYEFSNLLEGIVFQEASLASDTSEKQQDNNLNAVGVASIFGIIFIVAAVVVVSYVIVAECAEQKKAEENYSYNQNLEKNGGGANGVFLIDEQRDPPQCDYHFGYTTFAEVGCEVAAVYNLRIRLGMAENLSETIYKFERWAIEFSVGWGNLGSNPRSIYRYLRRENISYRRYTFLKRFISAVNNSSAENFIMSTWNPPEGLKHTLHTFLITGTSSMGYKAYNKQLRDTSKAEPLYDISEYNDGDGFIVGYIIL